MNRGHELGSPRLYPTGRWEKSCDYCYMQGLCKHYCDLHGVTVKNMDVVRCKDWQSKDSGRRAAGKDGAE